MTTIQVTIGAAATPISKVKQRVKQMFIQNNAANACRVGSSDVTISAKGILLSPGDPTATPPVPGGSMLVGAFVDYETELSDYYIAGTATDVIDVIIP